jgi:hypothetical protein
MADTSWVSEELANELRAQQGKLTSEKYRLYMREKWVALAPDFFREIVADIQAAVDEFNQWIAERRIRAPRMVVELRRSTHEAMISFEHLSMTVQLVEGGEIISCCSDDLAPRAYRVVMLPGEDTFVLRAHSGRSAAGPTVIRGEEAKAILSPLLEEVRKHLRLV